MQRLLTITDVSELTGLAVRTLYNYRAQQLGPPSFSLRGRVRYYEVEVERWISIQADENPR